MILAAARNDGPAFTFNVTVNGLAVYLDNWAIINLSEGDPSRRARFIDALHSGADLLFSVTNATELYGQRGRSLNAVKLFLDEVGPHWTPVELNPFNVVDRELKGMGSASCMSQDFMKAYFQNRMAGCQGKLIDLSEDFFRLGAVVEWVANSESLPKQSREFDELLKRKTVEYRTAFKRNPSRLNQSLRIFNPARPATFVCSNLIRTLIVESGQLKSGDALDFCHAVIGSAFASVAALDKHWKRRVENLPNPIGLQAFTPAENSTRW